MQSSQPNTPDSPGSPLWVRLYTNAFNGVFIRSRLYRRFHTFFRQSASFRANHFIRTLKYRLRFQGSHAAQPSSATRDLAPLALTTAPTEGAPPRTGHRRVGVPPASTCWSSAHWPPVWHPLSRRWPSEYRQPFDTAP